MDAEQNTVICQFPMASKCQNRDLNLGNLEQPGVFINTAPYCLSING